MLALCIFLVLFQENLDQQFPVFHFPPKLDFVLHACMFAIFDRQISLGPSINLGFNWLAAEFLQPGPQSELRKDFPWKCRHTKCRSDSCERYSSSSQLVSSIGCTSSG
jgi:hypothetical protein